MLYLADDIPKWSDDYKVITREQLKIPGVHMIGCANFQSVGGVLETHFHRNLEFVIIVKGKQKYVVGGKRYDLYGNEIFVTYPYEEHGNGEVIQDICEFIWFQIDLSSSENFLGLTPPRSEYLYQQMLHYNQRTKKADMKDISLLHKAFYLLGSKELSKQTLGYSYFLKFIVKNICTQDIEQKREIYSEDIQEALTFIHENLLNNLNIDMIAEECGLSTSRFKAKFKEELGITPHAYINALKIDSAKIYLKDMDKSITEIAYLLNFSSSNHFAAIFKKYTGYTPSDFRKKRVKSIF